ncbi:MAG: hypothetical protein AAF846_18660 [Chloroflexota bacterium]
MKRTIVALLALVVLVISFVLPAFAQDDEMMDTHVCDSTTILLLYIAEHDYGYVPMMDVSTFEKGQYAPLFDEMMAMMDEEMMDEEEMSDEDMGDEEMMDEEMSDEEMMDDMVTLELPVIEGEDPACTDLRAALDSFFDDALFGMMDDMEMESDG